MPKYRITGPNGQAYDIEAPEGATPEQVTAFVVSQMQGPKPTIPGASAGKGGLAGGVAMGLRDPIDAGAQLLRRAVPESVGRAVDAFGNTLADMGLPVARSEGVKGVDAVVNNANAQYDASRQMAGRDGIDAARIGGNIANPVNLVGGKALQAANTTRKMVGIGAGVGGASAALQPVIGEGNQADFGAAKATQVAAGIIGGAVLTPAVAKAGEAFAKSVNPIVQKFRGAGEQEIGNEVIRIMDAFAQTMRDTAGIDANQIPRATLAKVQQQVYEALKTGKQLDPNALLRKAEFEALGIQPTQGQVTRDPMQFARERNLRGIEGAGEPLAQRFSEQNNQLTSMLNRQAAGAVDPDVAGSRLMSALELQDRPVKANVSKAYSAARDNAGRSAMLDVQAFANRANDELDQQMLGRFLPEEAKGLLNDISSGKIPLNVNNLVQVDSVLSQAQRAAANNPAAQKAIGVVRDALNNAEIDSAAGQSAKAAFDNARGLARTRFSAIDQTPGLKAALDGEVPDTFVRKYLINGDTKSVNNLMMVLRNDEGAAAQARAQVGAYLRDKAFGANASGDKAFAQESYNKAIQSLGKNKLTAIFGQDDAEQLARIGRVANYMSSQPAGSAVNNSNTAGAVLNLIERVSGLPLLNVARDSVRTFSNERFARRALTGEPTPLPPELSGEARNNLLRLLAGPTAVGAGSLGGALGQ